MSTCCSEIVPGSTASGGGGSSGTGPELSITPALTVAPAAGTINNYNPAGFSTHSRIRLDTTAGNVNFTGFAAQGDGDLRIIENLGPNQVTLLNEDIGSVAANRFTAVPAPGVILTANASVILIYDATSVRWIPLAEPWTGIIVLDYLITQKFRLQGTVTPGAPLAAGATNDYALTAPSSTSRYLIGTNAAGSTLTGMVAQNNGDLVFITNTGPGLLTFTDQDAGSAAANQYMLPGALPLVLQDEGSVLFVYDTATGKWRPYAAIGLSRIDADVVNVSTTFHGDGFNRLYQTVIQGYIARNSTVTPAALAAGTTQDYDLNPGLSGANRIRQATNAANSALGGLVPNGVNGAEWVLVNLGPGTLTLNEQDAGSAVGNRFFNEGGVARVIGVNGAVILSYDGGIGGWTVIG